MSDQLSIIILKEETLDPNFSVRKKEEALRERKTLLIWQQIFPKLLHKQY